MIVFLGDSFTWGQGLYFKKWLKEGNPIKYCNQHLPPNFSQENISYSDDEYRRKHHFPNLVAKHYDRSYYSKPKNGGSNYTIYKMAAEINEYAHKNAVELVVVQFTDYTRNIHDSKYKSKLNIDYTDKKIDHIFDEIIKKEIKIVYDKLKDNNIKNFLFFSWRSDISNILEKDYNKYYTPLYYNNKKYESFDYLMLENPELQLSQELGIDDEHLSELGHRVIADSIIKKIDSMNIKFLRKISLV